MLNQIGILTYTLYRHSDLTKLERGRTKSGSGTPFRKAM